MRIFKRNGKINFVDKNNIMLGYDLNQDCCEYADWFIADTPQNTKQDCLDDNPDLEEWTFDTKFFRQIENAQDFEEGGMAIFRIINGKSEKFIHIFNCHNGYYGHGFQFGIGDRLIKDGGL